MARLPIKPVGNLRKFCVDKTISNKYVLRRPPKKPGGRSSAILLVVINLCLSIDGVEGSNLGANYRQTSERDDLLYLLIVGIFMTSIFTVVMMIIFILVIWFKYVDGVEQRGNILHK